MRGPVDVGGATTWGADGTRVRRGARDGGIVRRLASRRLARRPDSEERTEQNDRDNRLLDKLIDGARRAKELTRHLAPQ